MSIGRGAPVRGQQPYGTFVRCPSSAGPELLLFCDQVSLPSALELKPVADHCGSQFGHDDIAPKGGLLMTR